MRHRETDDGVVIEPADPARAAVIWLHGLGADGHDFVPIVPELGLADLPVRFVFPHAPVRPVTLNNGMRMRAWYDIVSLDRGRQDEGGIRESEKLVHGLLRHELAAGIAAQDIVLAGFSQGGAIALHTGLRYRQRLGGVIGLSTYLPIDEKLGDEVHAANRATPILLCHGRFDPMLPLALGQHSRDLLQYHGYAVEWHDYPMQHQVCPEEIRDIAAWLRARLAAPA